MLPHRGAAMRTSCVVQPKNKQKFTTSNHKNQEVATGTLKSILRDAGLK